MADTLDIITLAEGKTAVNIPSAETAHDTELALFITGLSRRIDELCGPVVVRTISGETHNGGKARVWFDVTPVDSVTSVVEWVSTTSNTLSAESNASKPASAYLLDNVHTRYFAWRRSGGSDVNFAEGRRNIVLTYVAGRYADTASVDERFKLATTTILRRLWKREQTAWAQSSAYFDAIENPTPSMRFYKAIDPMVKELLADELLSPVGL